MVQTAVIEQEEKRPSLGDILNPKKKAVLAAIEATGGNILRACKAAGVHTDSHYKWMRADPVYAEVFAQQYEQSTQTLIAEAIQRATEGTAEPIMYQGKQVHDAEGNPLFKYYKSDALLMFLLKHRDPSFKDNFSHNIGIWSKSGQVNLHFNIPRPAGEAITTGVKPTGNISHSDNIAYVNKSGQVEEQGAGEIIEAEAVEVEPVKGEE